MNRVFKLLLLATAVLVILWVDMAEGDHAQQAEKLRIEHLAQRAAVLAFNRQFSPQHPADSLTAYRLGPACLGPIFRKGRWLVVFGGGIVGPSVSVVLDKDLHIVGTHASYSTR